MSAPGEEQLRALRDRLVANRSLYFAVKETQAKIPTETSTKPTRSGIPTQPQRSPWPFHPAWRRSRNSPYASASIASRASRINRW